MIFEGRDAAGKGGTIKRVTEHLNPRVVRIAALATPSDREKTEWYFQRYVEHLPAAGEMVLFDRSWYNRAGVERVMGFCTEDEVWEFFRSCPEFERMLIRSGIILLKYWFSVSDEEQERRFQAASRTRSSSGSSARWTSRAACAGWSTRRPRTRCSLHRHQGLALVGGGRRRQAPRAAQLIHHLLSRSPTRTSLPKDLKLAERPPDKGYVRPPIDSQTFVPEVF